MGTAWGDTLGMGHPKVGGITFLALGCVTLGLGEVTTWG